MSFLEAANLNKSFQGLRAVQNLSFSIEQGGTVAVIGPNGAGKTTLFNLITGLIKPDTGRLSFRDEEITGLKPEAVARLGVTRTFQVTRLFKEMTVLENIMAGFHMHARASFPAVMAGLRKARREESSLKEKAMDLLEATGLKDEAQTVAGSMPYGLQRIVEMARALAGKPALLMLDEPAAGLNDRETATLVDFIRTIEGQGVTVLLVEHDVKMVMTVSRHVVVLNHGEKLAEGPPAEIRRHPEVVKAYLGKEY